MHSQHHLLNIARMMLALVHSIVSAVMTAAVAHPLAVSDSRLANCLCGQYTTGVANQRSGRLAMSHSERHAEPCYDIAHLAHVELFTPKPEASLAFFVNVMGMTESGREGDNVYLRGYDDYEFHTLKLTASNTTGIGHLAYRTASPQALARRVAALEAAGLGHGWVDGDMGHGQAYVARTPDGHSIELYYDTRWYEAPPHLKPALKNQAQAYPARGISVRRLDHMNLLVSDVAETRVFLETYLGLRTTEKIVKNDGSEAGAWVTATNKSYDLAFTADYTGEKGRGKSRFHHVRRRQPRGRSARGRHLPGGGRSHRDRPAQARGAANVLPLRLRARRQPR
jgi:catechol 2,3-dioxygenase-like lactoylglutathione lyase family enzyme